ncbi:MAG TPA: DUF1622 domain-containing protein [Chloroflexi bacterium]|jgi:uncharacterized membrane protein|nr:DUF1622 domain-containing protein [Chloroflexota bacterium]
MTEIVHAVISYLILLAEASSALVVTVGVVRAAAQFVQSYFRRDPAEMGPVRLRLGQSLVMALEFQVGADIMRTALSFTWDDLLRLAALVVLRTVLSLALEHELRLIARRAEVR